MPYSADTSPKWHTYTDHAGFWRQIRNSASDVPTGGFVLKKVAATGALAAMLTLTACSGGMSLEDAGQHYLSAVCPANTALDSIGPALDGDDLDAVHQSTSAYGEAARSAAKLLTDSSTKWPDEVDPEDLEAVADSYLADLAVINQYTEAQSIEEARSVFWPGDDAGSTAAQAIRLALDLPSDTTASCEAQQ